MDKVTLELGERDDAAAGIVAAVRILVNGRDLVDLAREAELPFAARAGRPDRAGGYVGLPPEEIFLPSRRLLGEPETYYDHDSVDGKLAVLGCVCGEPGCWPLLVRITVREYVVVWEDLEQPHRPRWSYDRLGRFVFDRAEYTAELRRGRGER